MKRLEFYSILLMVLFLVYIMPGFVVVVRITSDYGTLYATAIWFVYAVGLILIRVASLVVEHILKKEGENK